MFGIIKIDCVYCFLTKKEMMMKILNTVFKALHVVVLIGKQDVDFSASRCNK